MKMRFGAPLILALMTIGLGCTTAKKFGGELAFAEPQSKVWLATDKQQDKWQEVKPGKIDQGLIEGVYYYRIELTDGRRKDGIVALLGDDLVLIK